MVIQSTQWTIQPEVCLYLEATDLVTTVESDKNACLHSAILYELIHVHAFI